MRLRISVLFILVVLVMSATASASTFVVEGDGITLEFSITKGYYTDANQDGVENDVITEFAVIFSTTNNNIGSELDGVKLFTKVTLTLPDGQFFNYKYTTDLFYSLLTEDELASSYVELSLRMTFWDHALVSGDYLFEIQSSLINGGRSYGQAELLFDPPGSDGGNPPPPLVDRIDL